ncbi:hypothetical protein [Vibrio sp. D173a]|uniref:hypothetical protein n=1 Tax=Vibrio sp. D173a TaxID=2836349 RepID=UPI002554F55F|nr:hypothetical protein [Vibrio sp. D173a]
MSFYSPLFKNYLLIVLSVVLLYASYSIQAKMTAVDKNSVAQQNRQSLNNKKLRLKPASTSSASSKNRVIELRGKIRLLPKPFIRSFKSQHRLPPYSIYPPSSQRRNSGRLILL